ncbi:MAG: MSCRAMM family protein, partial [Acidobacteriota bacterium]
MTRRRAALALVALVALAALVAVVAWPRHGNRASDAARPAPERPAFAVAGPRGASGEAPAADPLADDDPAGTLRLEGQVLGAGDHPVGGATVVLGSTPPRTATTEADGGFAFDHLVARAYRITARAPAGIAGPVVAHLTDKSDPVVLHLRAGSKLAIDVVGGDGKPVDGADVELRGDDRQRAPAPGGKVTFAPLVPGPYTVVASAPGLAPAHQLVLVAGDTHARVVLAPGAPVSGKVVDDHGAPVAGARDVWLASGRFVAQAD